MKKQTKQTKKRPKEKDLQVKRKRKQIGDAKVHQPGHLVFTFKKEKEKEKEKENKNQKRKRRKHIQIEEEDDQLVEKHEPTENAENANTQMQTSEQVDQEIQKDHQETKRDDNFLTSLVFSSSLLASSVLANEKESEKSNSERRSTERKRENHRNLSFRSFSRSPSPSFVIDLTKKSKSEKVEKKKEQKKNGKSTPSRESFKKVVSDSEEDTETEKKERKNCSSSNKVYDIEFLSKTNAYKRNQDLKFQSAGHLYFIKGFSVDVLPDDPLYIEYKQQGDRFNFVDENGTLRVKKGPLSNRSSSEMSKIFMPESSTSSRIANVLRSRQIDNPTYKYFGKTVEWMEKTWKKTGDVAKDSGTEMHNRFEIFSNLYAQEREMTKLWIASLNQRKTENIENKHWLLWAKNEMEDKGLEPFYTEIPMFCEENRVTGSADLLLQKKGDSGWPRHVVLVDYKRSCKPLIENHQVYTACDFYQYGLGPFAKTHNTTYWHYAVQLNLYKYMLDKYYNLVVDEMYLLCIHPTLPSYVQKEVPNMQEHIQCMLEIRKECLDKNIYLEDYLYENDYDVCEKRKKQDEIDNLCVENQRSIDEETKTRQVEKEGEILDEGETYQ